jgi:hypothetical protein
MLAFFFPLDFDSNTAVKELKDRPCYVNPTVITRLREEIYNDLNTYDFNSLLLQGDTSTLVELKSDYLNSEFSATWNDIIEDEFDLTIKLQVNTSFKMKAKIKNVSNFTPKIFLD